VFEDVRAIDHVEPQVRWNQTLDGIAIEDEIDGLNPVDQMGYIWIGGILGAQSLCIAVIEVEDMGHPGFHEFRVVSRPDFQDVVIVANRIEQRLNAGRLDEP
jgi:hypothetical protein